MSSKMIPGPTTAIFCFSDLTDTQISPSVSLHTQGIRGSRKLLLLILQRAQNNTDQTLKSFYAWTLDKNNHAYGGFLT